jgi:hypothetical protein
MSFIFNAKAQRRRGYRLPAHTAARYRPMLLDLNLTVIHRLMPILRLNIGGILEEQKPLILNLPIIQKPVLVVYKV